MRAGLWVGILCIVWGLLPLQTVVAQGNKKAKVKIVNADSLLVGTLGKPSRFIGNVHMTHENTLMWCDSLYQYELPDSNYLEAFGHVRVIKNDSIRMSGDYMYYDANKKLIQVRRNVTLEDPQMVLTTDFLDYDGLFDIGYYFNWGQLKDSQNTLDSKKGNYFTQTKIALFKDSVKVNSPEYLIFSDTLKYNTETKLVSILGPTNIYGKGEDNNTLYSEDGWYDSNLGHAELYKNNRVTHLSYEGVADTMVIDSITGMAYLYWNVTLVDTVNNVNTLINSFHDIWHLPALQLVNRAWRERTPSALLEAIQYTEQAITALEHWYAAVEHLVQMNGDTVTVDQAWRIANDLEELACSLQYITAELAELAGVIAEKYAVSEYE